MMQMLRRMLGDSSVVQSGNVVDGDLVGGNIFINGARQGPQVQPEGPAKEQDRVVDAFNHLSIQGPFDVYFQVANESFVKIRAAENILPLIKTSVTKGRLSIRLQGSVHMKGLIPLRVCGPALTDLEIVGGGHFRSSRLVGSSLTVKTTGDGKAFIYGSVDRLELEHTGGGLIDSTRMDALHVHASLTGSGQIELEATDSVNASITGSGDIVVGGISPQVQRHITGSGHIEVTGKTR